MTTMEQVDQHLFSGASPANDPAGGRRTVFAVTRLRFVGASGAEDGFEVRVRNLSAGGLMAELPQAVAPDSVVEVELPAHGWVRGRVAWQTEGRAGIAFDEPVDPQAVMEPSAG